MQPESACFMRQINQLPFKRRSILKTKKRSQRAPRAPSSHQTYRSDTIKNEAGEFLFTENHFCLELIKSLAIVSGHTESMFDKQKQSLMCQYPVLSSINQLFDLESIEILTSQNNSSSSLRYIKIVELVANSAGNAISLSSQQRSAIIRVQEERRNQEQSPEMILLSKEQSQMLFKRCFFMEKLNKNQQKYASSLGRMSQISRELAFIYRTYLQQRTKLQTFLDRIPREPSLQFCGMKDYVTILIIKNIRHSVTYQGVQPYVYFQYKEHLEKGKDILSFYCQNSVQSYKNMLERRRKKRGRKVVLATACSVCFSDYFQTSNPFTNCNYCGLRTHKYCQSFQKHCGNCAYRKLERSLKRQISSCIICSQPGQMLVKFNESTFAHGWCLLVHGYWRIRQPAQQSESDSKMNILENVYRAQIEYLNPFLQKRSNKQQHVIIKKNYIDDQRDQKNKDFEEQLRNVGIKHLDDLWQQKNHIQQKCAYCCQIFFRNCHIYCQICKKPFHLFCAFMSGFHLDFLDNLQGQNLQKRLKLNCCIQNTFKRGFQRRFRLNYKKQAFEYLNFKEKHQYQKQQGQVSMEFLD